MKKGFTLLELIIVVVIIGVLVSFAAPQFATTKEKALEQEAKANLNLIMAAEKIYRMEQGQYYHYNTSTFAHSNSQEIIIAINNDLKLQIPSSTGRSWDYDLVIDNTVTPQTACAQAIRVNDANRNWHLTNLDDAPTTGTCGT